MNAKSWLSFALGLATPAFSFADPDPMAFLVKGESISVQAGNSIVAKGGATVLTTGGTRFTAGEIVVDHAGGTIRLSGNVLIHSVSDEISAKELMLDIRGKRLFLVSAGQVLVPSGSLPLTLEKPSLEFDHAIEKVQLELRRSEPKS